MQKRIEESIKIGRIPEVYDQHKRFLQWKSSFSSKIDHDTILQVFTNSSFMIFLKQISKGLDMLRFQIKVKGLVFIDQNCFYQLKLNFIDWNYIC